jgi:hypothetical protein
MGYQLGNQQGGGTIYVVPDPTLVPKYVFTETGVGCANHGDPNCLCDVHVGTPTAVTAGDINFARLAKQITGINKITVNNLEEFASTLLGMSDEHARIVNMSEQDMLAANVQPGNKHTGNPTPYSMLPNTVRDKLRECWATKVPWKLARMFLPEMLPAENIKAIGKYYNQRLYAKSTKKEKVSS